VLSLTDTQQTPVPNRIPDTSELCKLDNFPDHQMVDLVKHHPRKQHLQPSTVRKAVGILMRSSNIDAGSAKRIVEDHPKAEEYDILKLAHFVECLQRLLTEAGLQVTALDIINKRKALPNMTISDLEEKWRCVTSACEVNPGWMNELHEASSSYLSQVLDIPLTRLSRLPNAAPYETKTMRKVLTMSNSPVLV
jgi:hypothetical protein